MANDTQELYRATETLFRAFHYLQGRMQGGGVAPPMPMNAEALAGCILHACMGRLVREMQERRADTWMAGGLAVHQQAGRL